MMRHFLTAASALRCIGLGLFLVPTFALPAAAMKIQTLTTPGGITAWLVEDHSVPLLSMRFAFAGGNSQDPEDKPGVANFITAMMDEGAGDIKSSEFQERVEDIAMRMSYEDTKDALYGSFETLTANRAEAVKLLTLAINKPRFDADAMDRIRGQLLAGLVYAARDPEKVAAKEWYATAFAGHAYGRPANGTDQSLKAITGADLEAYRQRIFAKGNLKVVAVGDIDAAELATLLDQVFGSLPAEAKLNPVPLTTPAVGQQKVVEMAVPQSVAVFGLGAMPRKDPDFMAAFVLNHIIGGGGFSAKLMEEVREKRGLAYSVYTYLQPYQHTSILSGSVATKNESIAESLTVIKSELKRMADTGPTEADLRNAKDYLTGSYALRFDTSSKIATQLLSLMMEDFGPDYVENRNKLIEAVTLDDLKRVAKRLLIEDNLITTIVGKPVNLAGKG